MFLRAVGRPVCPEGSAKIAIFSRGWRTCTRKSHFHVRELMSTARKKKKKIKNPETQSVDPPRLDPPRPDPLKPLVAGGSAPAGSTAARFVAPRPPLTRIEEAEREGEDRQRDLCGRRTSPPWLELAAAATIAPSIVIARGWWICRSTTSSCRSRRSWERGSRGGGIRAIRG